MMDKLMSQAYADETFMAIDDTTTFDDPKHYGARYEDVQDQGTAHVSILAPNGDAIAATSTINYLLGAFFRSEQTGIIMNNEMDDFSSPGAPNVYGIPPSPANFIHPGKRPMSSMVPTILVDEKGDVRMVVGAAGGSRIPTGIFATIYNHLYMQQSLVDAVAARRLHHQLMPLELQWETGFDAEILRELNENFGHSLVESTPDGGFAAVTGIAVVDGKIEACFDPRRGGGVEVF
jgi:gamma-glutamyltranspeptidase/glutathione hydrolase/leukotriene-C4 hydrolase